MAPSTPTRLLPPPRLPGMDGPSAEITRLLYPQADDLTILKPRAMDAFLREYRIWVPADCTAAESTQAGKAPLHYMAEILRCDVKPASRARRPKKNDHA